MKILAVDYDGVISDSALKSLFTAHNAYCRYFGSEVKKNFGGEIFTFDNWERKKKEYHREMEKYQRLRAYVEYSCDFLVMIKIIEEEIPVRDQQEFRKIRSELDLDYEIFHELFFQEKEIWQKKDFTKWFALSPAYKGVTTGIKRLLQEGVKVVIATSNLGTAIHPAFHQDYLGFVLPIEDIFDKNYGRSKSDHMRAIAAQYRTDFNNICFIDDQLNYLEESKELGVQVFLDGWGYCTEEQKGIARKQDITVIEKETEFYSTFSKILI